MYWRQFAYIARYGKGIDAERFMRHRTISDVNSFQAALSALVEREQKRSEGE